MSETPLPQALDKEGVAECVRDVLRQEYKEARYLQIETAEAIASRVMGWAKLFGFFAGIPLLLLALWLGRLGYTSLNDVTKLEDQIGALQKDVVAKRAQLAKLKELDTLEQRLNALSTRVVALERLKFGGSGKIGTAAQHRIEETLMRYQARFAGLGFTFGANQEAHVQIETSASMQQKGAISYYDQETNTLVIDEQYTKSDDVVLREYAHRILTLANPRIKVLSDPNLMGLESGLADYFSRSFADVPAYTSFPERTLANQRKVFASQDYADVDRIGFAWGGLGWELRTKLGRDPADALLLKAWEMASLSGPTAAHDFAQALTNADHALNGGANAAVLRALLEKRGVSM